MKLRVQLYWQDNHVQEDTIELDEDKFEPLDEEEKEAAFETLIRDWINKNMAVRWELEE